MAETTALIPVMTSNTTPSGTVINNLYGGMSYPISGGGTLDYSFSYYAFDGRDTTCARYMSDNVSNGWIGYQFGQPVKANKVIAKIGCRNATDVFEAHIQAYINDEWIDVADQFNVGPDLPDGTYRTFDINFYKTYKSDRFRIFSPTLKVYPTDMLVVDVQLYYTPEPPKHSGITEAIRDWLNASLYNKEEIDRYFLENNGSDSSHETFQILTPVMTSDTDPSGVVSASSHRDGQSLEYYVFRQITPPNNIGCWCNIQGDTDRWLQYEFEEPVVVDYLRIWTPYYTDYTRICSPKKFVLKGSNDGTTWTDIQTFTGIDDILLTEYDFDVENSTAYLMYRIKFTETWDQYDTYVGVGRLDFCKKVSAPIKTIPYDLMIFTDKPDQMIKLVGQNSGKTYNLILESIINGLDYLKDSPYYVETTDWVLNYSGRKFRKTIAGPAYTTKLYWTTTNYTVPLFVSKDPEFVKYTTSDGGSFTYRATCDFFGETWYASGGSYGFSGKYTPCFITNQTAWGPEVIIEFLKHVYGM